MARLRYNILKELKCFSSIVLATPIEAGSSAVGIPDIYIHLKNGKAIWIECKLEGDTHSAMQIKQNIILNAYTIHLKNKVYSLYRFIGSHYRVSEAMKETLMQDTNLANIVTYIISQEEKIHAV